MNRSTTDSARIAEAAEWRLIGALLERPRAGWHQEIAALAGEVRDSALREAAAMARDASEGDYLSLLGPGGVVSPREVTYQPFADPGRVLAELAMVYDAFAFRPRVEEPLDHVAVEVAFVGYLVLKEAYAAARGERATAAITAAARGAFIEAHLAASAATFAERLEEVGPSYLLPTARLLAARLPPRPPVRLPAASPEIPDVCGACLMGSDD
jgi:hypothetical protein